jgi:hypothetical protein
MHRCKEAIVFPATPQKLDRVFSKIIDFNHVFSMSNNGEM